MKRKTLGARKKYGGYPNARRYKMKNGMIVGTCHFPLCCNFFRTEHSTRVYCKTHKAIPDSIKAFTVMKQSKFIGYFEVITKTTVRRLNRKEREKLDY